MSTLSSAPRTDDGSAAPLSAAAWRAVCSHIASGSGAPSGASDGCQVRRATPMMQVARGSAGNGWSGSAAGLAGHRNGPVGDDVLLDLGGPAADGRVALEGIQAGPLAPVDRVGTAPRQRAGGAEEGDGQFGERLGDRRPRELGERD